MNIPYFSYYYQGINHLSRLSPSYLEVEILLWHFYYFSCLITEVSGCFQHFSEEYREYDEQEFLQGLSQNSYAFWSQDIYFFFLIFILGQSHCNSYIELMFLQHLDEAELLGFYLQLVLLITLKF